MAQQSSRRTIFAHLPPQLLSSSSVPCQGANYLQSTYKLRRRFPLLPKITHKAVRRKVAPPTAEEETLATETTETEMAEIV